MATSLAGFINVPTLAGTTATSYVPTIAEPFPSFELPTEDFSVASVNQKVAEAALKITSEGTLPNMTNLTGGVGLINDGLGGKLPVDPTTGKAIGKPSEPNNASTERIVSTTGDNRKDKETFKVKITSKPDGKTVVFDAMPTISESRSVSYEPFSPVHHPGEILKYKNTAARAWTISVRLISRNKNEAANNLEIVNIVRGWAMPYYGEGTRATSSENLGAPPQILTLQAYGATAIGPVPCVMESYSTTWPNDVDYIYSGKGPFPVLLQLEISLKESYSPSEYSQFDLIKYRKGELPSAFNISSNENNKDEPKRSGEPANNAAQFGPPTPPMPPFSVTSESNTYSGDGNAFDYNTSGG